ncbi:MAG: hypothetical protein RL518_2705 [Pseudomonadota bacterium]
MIQPRDPGREDDLQRRKLPNSSAMGGDSNGLSAFDRGAIAPTLSPWLWLGTDSSSPCQKLPAARTRCANIYIADTFSHVVASESASVFDHGALSLDLREHLTKNPDRAPGVNLDTLPTYQVAAFIDGPNILIRIEDSRLYFDRISQALREGQGIEAARHALFQEVNRYRRAIDVALKGAEEKGGEVLLLAGGFSPEDQDARLKIAKILGEVHRVHEPRVSTRAKFVAGHLTQAPWGQYYYRKEQGTRYLSVEHLSTLGDHILTAPATFLEGITIVAEWLRTRNKQGAKEAVLLLIDDTGSSLLKDSAVERRLKERLSEIAAIARCVRMDRWASRATMISKLFDDVVSIFKASTHKDFRCDDLHNPRYVEVVANILRGQADNLALGAGFSTPLKAIPVGGFIKEGNGRRSFQTTTQDPILREIVTWFLSEENTTNAQPDWLCLFEPKIALTPDYHPALVARSLLPQDEQNFIVLTGVAGEEERKYVIRQNPYSADHWDDVDSDRLSQIKSTFSSEQLADAAIEAIAQQYELINGLYSSLEDGINATSRHGKFFSEGQSLAVPTFAPIQISPSRRRGDFFIRPLIDGDRLDLISRSEMSPEQMEYALRWIGKLMAVNFLAQRPAFSLHELLSIRGGNGDGYIRSIGASESFCNSINVSTVPEMLEKGAVLYGSHLATWIMSLRFGAYAGSLPASDEIDRRLISSCLVSFGRAYGLIADKAPLRFMPLASSVLRSAQTSSALLKEVPELDIGRNVPLTLKLLQLTSAERAALFRSIRGITFEMCDFMSRMCADPESRDGSNAEEQCRVRKHRELLIDRIYSLVGNHLSGDSFGAVREVINQSAIDFTPYSLEERAWILTIIDVELWLTAVDDDVERFPLWCIASESGTVNHFLNIVRRSFWHACLSEKRAMDFYEAVHGLEREFTHLSGRRNALERDLMRACNFTPPWEDSSTS